MDTTYNIYILGESSGWLQRALKPLVCFKCGKLGHIAVWCTSGGDSGDSGLVNGQVRCNGVGHWARYNIKVNRYALLMILVLNTCYLKKVFHRDIIVNALVMLLL